MFKGFVNEIFIHSNKYVKIKLVLSNGNNIESRYRSNDTTFYTIYSEVTHDNVTSERKAELIDSLTGKRIATITFTMLDLPDKFAGINSINGDTVKKEILLASNGLCVKYSNPICTYPYYIRQYFFKTEVKGEKVVIKALGQQFTEEIRQTISRPPKYTAIFFTDISATCSNCAGRRFDDIRFVVY